MTVWLLVKPRLRLHDAIDMFVRRLADLRDSHSFIMKPSYVSTPDTMNHDDFFTCLMSEHAEEDPFVQNFLEIFNGATTNSKFSPLVTNRLLTPILPKHLVPDASIQDQLTSRLKNLLSQLRGKFNSKLNCLILAPDAADFTTSLQIGFQVGDGYTAKDTDLLTKHMEYSLAYGEREIVNSGVFDSVHKLTVPSGASFAFLYCYLLTLNIPLPAILPTSFIAPREIVDFYMIEALVPPSVRGTLISARPSECSLSALCYRSIIEVLALTCNMDPPIEAHHIEAFSGREINISHYTLADALRLDHASRQRFLWRTRET